MIKELAQKLNELTNNDKLTTINVHNLKNHEFRISGVTLIVGNKTYTLNKEQMQLLRKLEMEGSVTTLILKPTR